MSTYTSKPGKRKASGNVPLLQWILAIGVALFLLIFPYNQALFNGYAYNFENKIYPALVYAFVLLVIAALHIFSKGWNLASHRGILSIGVLLFPVAYWLSSFQAVAPYYSQLMTMIVFALAALFVTALFAADKIQTRKLIEYALMLTSYIIVFIGVLILFGQIYLRDGMWLSSTGYRLTSVFQYSNTYGGFLIALFFAALYYTVYCKRWYMIALNAMMLVPIWISFMLSYSRGAIVVIPFILLIAVPFFKFAKQMAYIAYMVVSVIVSMLFLSPLTANTEKISAIVQPTSEHGADTLSMFSSLPLQSWLLLLAAMAISTAIIVWIQLRLYPKFEAKTAKVESRRGSFLFVPGIIVIIGAIAAAIVMTNNPIRSLLPDTLEQRLATINFNQHSVLERWTFYEDGFKASQDYPVLGAGGGAWQALFQQYQNNPYWSKQAHSYFVQTLVEVGWVGLAVLVGLLAYCYFLYIRFYMKYPERRGSHFVFFIVSVSLLLHSAMDFDMSYVYISAVVFICLGAMLAPYGNLMGLKQKSEEESSLSSKAAAKAENQSGKLGKAIYAGAIGIIAIVLLFGAFKQVNANRLYSEALALAKSGENISDLLKPLNEAIESSPGNSQFSLIKINWLKQVLQNTDNVDYLKEALATVDAAKENDPYNRNVILERYQLLKISSQPEAMLVELEDGLDKFRWDNTFYEAAIVEYVAAGEADTAKQAEYWNRAAEIGEEVQRRIDKLSELPPEQLQGRAFAFTDAMKEALAKIK